MYYLWGVMKDTECGKKPKNLKYLYREITNSIKNISVRTVHFLVCQSVLFPLYYTSVHIVYTLYWNNSVLVTKIIICNWNIIFLKLLNFSGKSVKNTWLINSVVVIPVLVFFAKWFGKNIFNNEIFFNGWPSFVTIFLINTFNHQIWQKIMLPTKLCYIKTIKICSFFCEWLSLSKIKT